MGRRRGCGAWVASVGVERGSPDLTNCVPDTPSRTRRRSLVWVWSVGHRISWIVSQTLRLGLEEVYWFGCGVWVVGSRRSCPRRSVSDSKTFTVWVIDLGHGFALHFGFGIDGGCWRGLAKSSG
uniref:Uncharacterized protein n=1 Tax=Fagus sylvatica TaxID=28930 RepID=A0A2N9G4B6_FAGSY